MAENKIIFPSKLDTPEGALYGLINAWKVSGFKTVNTIGDLQNIPPRILGDLSEGNNPNGQLVFVQEESVFYQYLNSEWVEFATGIPVDGDPGSYVIKKLEDGTVVVVTWDEQMSNTVDGESTTYSDGKIHAIGGGGGGTSLLTRVYWDGLNYRTTVLQSNTSSANISFVAKSETRVTEESAWQNNNHYIEVKMSVMNPGQTDYEEKYTLNVLSFSTFTIDIRPYIRIGINNIRFTLRDTSNGLVYSPDAISINYSDMAVTADTFAWWTKFNSSINIPLRILGNISKTVHVRFNQKGGTPGTPITMDVGTTVYDAQPYIFNIPAPSTPEIYTIQIWLTANNDASATTDNLVFDIVWSNETNYHYFVINNINRNVNNWAESRLFDYALISSLTSETVSIAATTESITEHLFDDSLLINQGTKYSYSKQLEVIVANNANFSMSFEVSTESGIDNTYTDLISVKNSVGFAATPGATVFFNPKLRSNEQSNRGLWINTVDGTQYSGQSTVGFSQNSGWVNGKFICKSKQYQYINLAPLATEIATTGWTFEMQYLTENVTDETLPIFTIGNVLQITPASILMKNNQMTNTANVVLSTPIGETIHLMIVVQPLAYGRLYSVRYYIDGSVNKTYYYGNTNTFIDPSSIKIGSDGGDIEIDAIRIYPNALNFTPILNNYISLLNADSATKSDLLMKNGLVDNQGRPDFLKCSEYYNCLCVVGREPTVVDGIRTYPDLPTNWNPITGKSGQLPVVAVNIEFTSKQDGVNSFTCHTQRLRGQGTSSMTYWRWNFRWDRIDEVNGVTGARGMTVPFIVGEPEVGYFTAKINWASSMQDHKLGGCRLFDDVFKNMELSNSFTENGAPVAVRQVPALGFYKWTDDNNQIQYEFVGEFTFGADKGDETTFDYGTEDFISIEGSDNDPEESGFLRPFKDDAGNNRIWYDADDTENWKNPAGVEVWDMNAGETSLFEQLWRLPYELAYAYNPFFNFDQTNTRYDYVDANGDVWYYEKADTTWHRSYVSGEFNGTGTDGLLNIYTQTGLSAGATKQQLIDARVALFRAKFPDYYISQNVFLFLMNVLLRAGTDEQAKNTYPQIRIGSKVDFREDDTDTSGSINNQGVDDKPYWIEFSDTRASNGAPYWNGSDNALFNLIRLAFPGELKSVGASMLQSMINLGGGNSSDSTENLMASWYKYFGNIKRYFTQNAINNFAQYYDEAWMMYLDGKYTSSDVEAWKQMHGDYYRPEEYWWRMRFIYMQSKFSFGIFKDDSNDAIRFRSSGADITLNIIPDINMYCTVYSGVSLAAAIGRTFAGDTYSIVVTSSGDQQIAICGASYLRDIGDLSQQAISGAIPIHGKALRRIKAGDVNGATNTITNLVLTDLPSVEEIDVQNIATFVGNDSGAFDATAATSLQTMLAKGINVSAVLIAPDAPLTRIEYPNTIQSIELHDISDLNNANLVCDDLSNVERVWTTNPGALEVPRLLSDIMNTAANKLKYIRVENIDDVYSDSSILDKLVEITNGGYFGINEDGSASSGKPIITGVITIDGGGYQDVKDTIEEYFTGLTINFTGDVYVRFIDQYMTQLAIALWSTDGLGVTAADLHAVDVIGNNVFNGIHATKTINNLGFNTNTSVNSSNVDLLLKIEDMSDFRQKMTGLTTVNQGNFVLMPRLKKITVDGNWFSPNGDLNASRYCFQALYSLEELVIYGVLAFHQQQFTQCPNAKFIFNGTFRNGVLFSSVGYTEIDQYGNKVFKYIPISNTSGSNVNASFGTTYIGNLGMTGSTDILEIMEGNVGLGGVNDQNVMLVKLPSTCETLTLSTRTKIKYFVCKNPAMVVTGNPYYGLNKVVFFVPDSAVDYYTTMLNALSATRFQVKTITEYNATNDGALVIKKPVVSLSDYVIGKNGGTVTINIECDGEWTINQLSSGLTVSQNTGTGNATIIGAIAALANDATVGRYLYFQCYAPFVNVPDEPSGNSGVFNLILQTNTDNP